MVKYNARQFLDVYYAPLSLFSQCRVIYNKYILEHGNTVLFFTLVALTILRVEFQKTFQQRRAQNILLKIYVVEGFISPLVKPVFGAWAVETPMPSTTHIQFN